MKVFVTQDYDLFDIFATREAAWKTLGDEFEKKWQDAHDSSSKEYGYMWAEKWRTISKEDAAKQAKEQWIEEREVKE